MEVLEKEYDKSTKERLLGIDLNPRIMPDCSKYDHPLKTINMIKVKSTNSKKDKK